MNTSSNELFLGPERRFVYDCVYGPSSCQEDVYLSSLEPLLATLLDGYNVSVILYGAAGTGKTHTLVGPGPSLGPVVEEENFGLIPRSVRYGETNILKGNSYCQNVSGAFLTPCPRCKCPISSVGWR